MVQLYMFTKAGPCVSCVITDLKHLPILLQYSSSRNPSQSLSIWSPMVIVDTVLVHGCKILTDN